MNNQFISYDLHAPVKNYERVISAIKNLGGVPVQKSLWFLKTYQTAQQTANTVWAAMDRDDSLIVVDATKNDAAWHNLNLALGKHLQDTWHR